MRGIFPRSPPAKKLKLKHIPAPLCQENQERSQRRELSEQRWLQTPKRGSGGVGGGSGLADPLPPQLLAFYFLQTHLKSVIWLQFPEDTGERGRWGRGKGMEGKAERERGWREIMGGGMWGW